MGKHSHRWRFITKTEKICISCGVKRRHEEMFPGVRTKYVYQQWFGGWHHQCPPCAPLEERKRRWQENRTPSKIVSKKLIDSFSRNYRKEIEDEFVRQMNEERR